MWLDKTQNNPTSSKTRHSAALSRSVLPLQSFSATDWTIISCGEIHCLVASCMAWTGPGTLDGIPLWPFPRTAAVSVWICKTLHAWWLLPHVNFQFWIASATGLHRRDAWRCLLLFSSRYSDMPTHIASRCSRECMNWYVRK